MPQIQVKTVNSEQVWRSPDGQKTIWKVGFDYNGKSVQAKTYSNAISEVGWQGTVETYEKEGRNGSETFVKQPQKEWSGGSGGGSPSGGYSGNRNSGGGGKPPADSYTMYLSYVKDIAVALINSDKYSADQLGEIVTDVAGAGEMFYEMRPGGAGVKTQPAASELDDVFGATKQLEEDVPWQNDDL